VIVSSPQELALTIVAKAINMAGIMRVPILGLVENMSYLDCPHCGKRIELFGRSKGRKASDLAKIEFLGSIPVDPRVSELCDEGKIEEYTSQESTSIAQRVIDKTRQVNVPEPVRHTGNHAENEEQR